ncbi:MAG: molybdopterin containing oxidoreductase, partial [Flavobacteriaceae bacterium]|nr:molybdopterin containing oxidoreductase [Flavobacteriaceae bacterium]
MERRKFIKNTLLGTSATCLGLDIVFSSNLPDNYIPIAFQETDPFTLFNKDKDMQILNDKPWNIEAQAHLL